MLQEKRREERIQLETTVLLANGLGTSRDISNSGIYFLTEQVHVPGGVVNFSLQLEYACPSKPFTLNCRGEVLRVEPAGQQFGIAASIRECWCSLHA